VLRKFNNMLLEIKTCTSRSTARKFSKGVDLTVEKGSVHAIMGPNGSGKSNTFLCAGRKEAYKVTQGHVLLDGEDLLALAPDERAAKACSSPPISARNPWRCHHDIPAHRDQCATQERGQAEMLTPELSKPCAMWQAGLAIEQDMLRRGVNVGFSGGEKKRNEVLQMALLEPRLCVLDETDSGLDIDALKVVAEGVNRLRSPDRSFVVITHYQRLLDYIVPDVVHVLSRGRIVRTGGKELAHELEARGYAEYLKEVREPTCLDQVAYEARQDG